MVSFGGRSLCQLTCAALLWESRRRGIIQQAMLRSARGIPRQSKWDVLYAGPGRRPIQIVRIWLTFTNEGHLDSAPRLKKKETIWGSLTVHWRSMISDKWYVCRSESDPKNPERASGGLVRPLSDFDRLELEADSASWSVGRWRMAVSGWASVQLSGSRFGHGETLGGDFGIKYSPSATRISSSGSTVVLLSAACSSRAVQTCCAAVLLTVRVGSRDLLERFIFIFYRFIIVVSFVVSYYVLNPSPWVDSTLQSWTLTSMFQASPVCYLETT
jgi:hypothetical protein